MEPHVINLDRKQAWLQFVRYLHARHSFRSQKWSGDFWLLSFESSRKKDKFRAVAPVDFARCPPKGLRPSPTAAAASTQPALASLIYRSRDRLRPLIKITETADAVGMSSWCPLPASASSTSSRCRRRGQWNSADLLGARLVRHKPVGATPSYVSVLNRIEQEMFPKREQLPYPTCHTSVRERQL